MGLLDILKFVTMHFELFLGKDDQFYFRLKNAAGDTVLFSEGYTSKAAAEKGILSVKKNGTDGSRFQIRDKSFSLKASNGQVIGQSPQFSDSEKRDKAIEEIMENVADAEMNEL